MFFMGLHNLPPGKCMYTAFVGNDESHDEVDFVYDEAYGSDAALLKAAEKACKEGYDLETQHVLGIADQSNGGIVWRRVSCPRCNAVIHERPAWECKSCGIDITDILENEEL